MATPEVSPYLETPEVYGDSTTPEVDGSVSDINAKISNLAATITQTTSNDYDKCKLIEAYLRQYKYDTNAPGGYDPQSKMSTPEGMSDIAGRFLFETGTGYCVHYTSAMVMLLRYAGIPARAAAGYRYAFPLEEQETYEVSAGCAHVWPEAYLENAGWVPFEPTVVYRTASEYTWHREAPGTASGKKETPTETSPTSEVPESSVEETASEAASIVRIVLPVILSILLLLTALIAGTRVISAWRYNHSSPEKRLSIDVEMIKKLIRRKSPEQFNDRGLLSDYVDHAPEEFRPDLRKVFASYYRVLYADSGHRATAEENELAQSLRKKLAGEL